MISYDMNIYKKYKIIKMQKQKQKKVEKSKKIRESYNIDFQTDKSDIMLQDYSKSFTMGSNKKFINLTLPQIQKKKKQHYKKQPYCIVCNRNFTTTYRQHHCRVCANAVCTDCSRSMINKQRACDICIIKLSNPKQQKKKKQILDTLELLCSFLLFQKNQKICQLEQLKNVDGVHSQQYRLELNKQQNTIKLLQDQHIKLKLQQKQAQQRLQKIRDDNEKMYDKIHELQNSSASHEKIQI